jgi:hypothetical protein
MTTLPNLRRINAGVLDVAFHDLGPASGPPVFLMHGFPYDVHSYLEVGPMLAANGCRVLVPYLRGFGPTRFLNAATPRSGEQAALGADLLALMEALKVGWPRRLCGRRLVARSVQGPGFVQQLQHPEHCAGHGARFARERTHVVVPVLFSQ